MASIKADYSSNVTYQFPDSHKGLQKKGYLAAYTVSYPADPAIGKTDEISKVAKAKTGQPNFGASFPAMWVVSDISGFAHDTTLAVSMVRGETPPKALKAFDMMSSLNALNAAMRLKDGVDLLKASIKNKDKAGATNGIFSITIAILKLGATLPVLPVDAAKIILKYMGKTIPLLLSKCYQIFSGTVGALASSAMTLFMAFKLALEVRFVYRYHKEAKGLEGDARVKAHLEFLLGHFEMGSKEKANLFQQVTGDEAFYNEIRSCPVEEEDFAIDPTLDKMIDDKFSELISAGENEKAYLIHHNRGIAAHIFKKLAEPIVAAHSRAAARVLGDEAIYQLKAELKKPHDERILTRIEAGDATAIEAAKKLIGKTALFLSIETVMRTLMMTAGAIGILTAVGSIVATGPLAPLIMLGLSILAGAIWIFADSYSTITALRHDAPGKYEALILTITSVILGITGTAAMLFTTGATMGIIIGAVTLLWLIVIMTTFIVHMVKKQKLRAQMQAS